MYNINIKTIYGGKIMKAKTTRKWIASAYTCYGTGYGDLQYLLRFQDARFYTCGVYGWNCDIYTFGGYAITTGYRGQVHHVDRQYELEREYDKKAEEIIGNYELSAEERERKVNTLLKDFLQKVFNADIWVYGAEK